MISKYSKQIQISSNMVIYFSFEYLTWTKRKGHTVSRQFASWTIRPGQLAPDLQTNSALFFYPLQSQKRRKCMIPKLNAIEIILLSFIHNQTNCSSFFYPLPSLKFGSHTGRKNGFTRVTKLKQKCSKYHICTNLLKFVQE